MINKKNIFILIFIILIIFIIILFAYNSNKKIYLSDKYYNNGEYKEIESTYLNEIKKR